MQSLDLASHTKATSGADVGILSEVKQPAAGPSEELPITLRTEELERIALGLFRDRSRDQRQVD